MGYEVWVFQEFTEILPDHRVKLPGRNLASRTTIFTTELDRTRFSTTTIVGISFWHRYSNTPQLATSATDKSPKQIRMSGVISPRKCPIVGQLFLNCRKRLWRDQHWHMCDQEPLFRWLAKRAAR